MSDNTNGNDSRKKGWFKRVFGEYTPPSWASRLFSSKKFRKISKIVLISLGGLVAAFILLLLGTALFDFIESKKPVEMSLRYTISEPQCEYNARDEVYIEFTGSAAPLDDIEKDVSDKVTLSPSIAGCWRWENEELLVFYPEEDWVPGTTYTVSFGEGLVAKHIKLSKKSPKKFTTAGLELSLHYLEYTIDDTDPSKKFITFEIESNYPLADEDISSLIKIQPDMKNPSNGTIENKNYSCTVTYSEDFKTAYVCSEPMGIPATDLDIQVTVAKGIHDASSVISSTSVLEDWITVSGASSYARIEDYGFSFLLNDTQQYEQVLTIETSAKVSTEELKDNLELYLLPVDRAEEPGTRAIDDIEWDEYGTDMVTAKVLSDSVKLSVEPYETETEYEKLHSFALDVDEDRYIYFKVKAGTKFYGSYYLAKDYEGIVAVRDYPREIKFASTGSLISMNGSHKIPFLVRGEDKIYLTISRLKTTEINHIVSQSNGNLNSFRFDSSSFDEDNVGEYIFDSYIKTKASNPKDVCYESFDFSSYLDTIPSKDLRSGLFLVKLKDDGYSSVKKLVQVTDQSLIIKKNTDGGMDVFVQSISTGRPVASSSIKVIALNGNVLSSTSTDSQGHAWLPSLSSQDLEAVAITAEKGSDFAFVPYSLNGRYVDYSDFDTGGVYGSEDKNKIFAYIFNDRGIYRPGEEIRFGAIIKTVSWQNSVSGMPFRYVIKDSNGNYVSDREFSASSDGFEEIKYTTKDYSPTGTYTLYLYLKKKHEYNDGYDYIPVGSCDAKVEEFQSDTLQITSTLEPLAGEGWIKPQALTGVVKLKNLFGTDAAGNTVKADITLNPGYMRFSRYRDYAFRDPYVSKNSYSEVLPEEETDEEGYARFDIDVEKFEKASYRLTFSADGFEKDSGRSVNASSSIYISPLDYIIGVKSDGDLSYINKNSARNLRFIAVGPDLKSMAVDGVNVTITENRYVSVLVKQPNGVYKYQSVKKEYPVKSETITIAKDGTSYSLPVDTEGDYVLTLTDKNGLEFTSTSFSVIGSQNLQRSLSRTAEIEVKMAKSDFKNGEEAELLIKAPYAGSGLICVERDKVYSYKWFTSSTASSVQKVRIPEGLEGNGYITIMYMRDYNSDEVYMSPFCYAAVPFSVSLDSRKNSISLEVSDVVKPDTDYVIKYSSARKGKIVIMAVDEGILQVARYSSPDPLSFFFRKRALEVSTYQTLDLIMPEYNVLKTLTATGGDGFYDEALSHNLNPFKRRQNESVAYWSGILDTDSTVRSVTYHIPSYFNGKLRVMAVAVSDSSLGTAETSSEVQDDYIIVPNCPMFASPTDSFDVSVTVTNLDAGSGKDAKVKLSAVADKALSIEGDREVTLDIAEGKDATYTFKFKVNDDVLGNADIVFKAQGKNASSSYTSSLSIRPSVPYQVWLSSGLVRKDKNKNDKVDVDKKLYDDFATREVSLSYLPLGLAKGLYFYLDNYPYGCSEQITSAAFPCLYPDLLKECNIPDDDAEAVVNSAIETLISRQKSDGSIGYWTYKSASYASLDDYCALFLTIAREKGYFVPDTMMDRLLDHLKDIAEGEGYPASFAIYVLTRNEIVTTSYLEHLSKTMTKEDKMSMEGLYAAASYRMLKMDDKGKSMMNKVKKGMERDIYSGCFEDSLYNNASFLFLISEYYPEYLSLIGSDLIDAIEEPLRYGQYTTLSSSMTMMALESYLNAVPDAKSGKFTVTQDFGKEKSAEDLSFEGERVFDSDFDGRAKELILTNSENTNLYYQITQAGFLKNSEIKEIDGNGLEITREYSLAGSKPSTRFSLGDTINVTVRIRSTKKTSIQNVAFVDMLPSCFEVDRDSIREGDTDWEPDYVDIREDRVVFYGTADTSVRTFTYKVKAVTTGDFIVPPLFAQAMYDNNTKALKPYQRIVIEKNNED